MDCFIQQFDLFLMEFQTKAGDQNMIAKALLNETILSISLTVLNYKVYQSINKIPVISTYTMWHSIGKCFCRVHPFRTRASDIKGPPSPDKKPRTSQKMQAY